ncbi:hypothetical protein [Serratia liquefaciens]|uniref:hypothetical protein n=1 Tax=Serratia liquefaciens TaxID=614 RepID=UPI0021781843|nr:hypothetical protein [Serratia liquefaciens]CAI0729855.1 Uncharacterised protein [Serratia liquefaciens]
MRAAPQGEIDNENRPALLFDDLSMRAVQYNARASVEDFDACMAQYEQLAA